MLVVGKVTLSRGGDLRRFYTKQHKSYCGIDLHARSMDVCVLHQDGDIVMHRNMQASPETFLRAVAPYRDDLVVAVACVFPWYWLADLCAQEGMPFVLGHALSMKAIHGGKATNDKIDAHKIAVLLRGGMLPQAYVSPAEMRATRDLLAAPHVSRPQTGGAPGAHPEHQQPVQPARDRQKAGRQSQPRWRRRAVPRSRSASRAWQWLSP